VGARGGGPETLSSVHALEQRLARLATSLGGAYDGVTEGAQDNS
jgi:hypothetical protein